MAPSMSTTRRGRASLVPLALAAAVSTALLRGASPLFGASDVQAFSSVATGSSRKQVRSQLRTRNELPKNPLEISLEEEPEEVEQAEAMPARRVPYTVNLVTHFPNNKGLSEESSARKYLEKKLTGSLDHMEDMIRSVELQLKVEEHFHREKEGHKKVVVPETTAVETSDGNIVEEPTVDYGSTGSKVLAPYQIKVLVTLKNGKEVIYSNPEKHAEGTLTEAADSMADALRKLLREEKGKEINSQRQAKATDVDLDTFEDEPIDEIGAAEDAAVEEMYERIEATRD